MLQVIANFEDKVAHYSPLLLVVPGIFSVAVGLCIWLAGLKFCKAIAVVLAAAAGSAIGAAVVRANPLPAALFCATIASLIAMIFDKIVIIFVGSILLSLITLTIYAGTYLSTNDTPGNHIASALNQQETVAMIKKQAAAYVSMLANALAKLPILTWPTAFIGFAILIAIGYFLVRLEIALFCSTIGTFLIFTGMLALLLHKGSAPLTDICSRPSFFGGAAAAMIAFGTLVQLVLCQPCGPTQIPAGIPPKQPAKPIRGDV